MKHPGKREREKREGGWERVGRRRLPRAGQHQDQWTAQGSFRGMESFEHFLVPMVAQLSRFTKNHVSVHFSWWIL